MTAQHQGWLTKRYAIYTRKTVLVAASAKNTIYFSQQRDALRRFHLTALRFVLRMKPLKSRFIVLSLNFFSTQGMRLCAYLTSHIPSYAVSVFFFVSFRCSFREDAPLPLGCWNSFSWPWEQFRSILFEEAFATTCLSTAVPWIWKCFTG